MVEDHGSRKRNRERVEHALKARVRDKEAEDVGAKAYAEYTRLNGEGQRAYLM